MALHCVVDPCTLWLVSEEDGPNAETFMRATLPWLRKTDVGPYKLVISRSSLDAVSELGLFPAEAHLTNILDKLGISHVISAKQLASMVAQFISTAPVFEDRCTTTKQDFQPGDDKAGLCGVVANEELRLLSFAASAHAAVERNVAQPALLYGFPRIACPIEVTTITTEHIKEKDSVVYVVEVENELVVVRGPEQIAEAAEPFVVWHQAECIYEKKYAIEIYARQLAREIGSDCREFYIGSKFFESLMDSKITGVADYESVVFEKCAQVVARHPAAQAKDFRVSPASTAPVRVRQADRARAKRVHVTSDGPAFRLMFWDRGDGILEFACVGPKWEETIVAGDPDKAV